MSHVRMSRHELPFALIKPVRSVPRLKKIQIIDKPTIDDVTLLFLDLARSDVVAFDFETRGTQAYRDDNYVVGVGFSWDKGSAYFNLTKASPEIIQYILDGLTGTCLAGKLIAHNAYFDGAWVYRQQGVHPGWLACTYGLLYQLANEGFEGQLWGLKWAQENILQWTNTNEEGLDRWLIDNNLIKSTSKDKKQGYYWYHQHTKEKWKMRKNEEGVLVRTLVDDGGRWVKPDKSEMWQAPPEILGHYCCLDADATYQLYVNVLAPALARFPELERYHREDFLGLVKDLTEQHLFGIKINRKGLTARSEELKKEIDIATMSILRHPQVSPYITEYESMKLKGHHDKEPARFTKKKEQPEEPPKYKKSTLGKEPPKYKKDGTLSTNWEKWNNKRQDQIENPPINLNWITWTENVKAGKYKPTVSLNWKNWHEKLQRILRGEESSYLFNLNSGPQLSWLLYEKLGYPVLLYTKKQKPATGGKALGAMGEIGALLRKHDRMHKELSYVDAYLTMLTDDDRLHPSFRVPGTLTGRLAGKAPNIQQVPKSAGTMKNFIPDKGCVFVDCDHKALEQVVLAELSEDPALMKLYGPGAKPNDVYLFVGANFPGGIGSKIRATGYDPEHPTAESVAKAKKECKHERSIYCKKTVLSAAYGAGWKKMHQEFQLAGADVSEEDAQGIHASYWDTFAGVKRYGYRLLEEWRVRGGWVLSGTGRPIAVDEKYKKDIVNRVCQATGHDIHMMYVKIIKQLFIDAGIEVRPIVLDWHDQSIVQCRKEDAKQVAFLMEKAAYKLLNAKLGGIIPMEGEAMIVRNMAECKLEEEELGYSLDEEETA